jgi:hypothetical protein
MRDRADRQRTRADFTVQPTMKLVRENLAIDGVVRTAEV